jgi:hypothetical protein
MKRLCVLIAVLIVIALVPGIANAQCTSIQSGLLLYQPAHYLAGQPITTGANPYGYNYQAHLYSGSYFNAYAGGDGYPPYDGNDAAYLTANPSVAGHWAWPYRSVTVAMKWNDAWLSNTDCDGDGKLDRHYGYASYVGSGAWLTNHTTWTVVDAKGKQKNAYEFTKIAAIPVDAVIALPIDPYYGELTIYINGLIMGPQLWGEFAVIQDVLNDKSTGDHGLYLKGQISAGFGFFKP